MSKVKELTIRFICTPMDDYEGEFKYSKDNRRGLSQGQPTSDKAGIIDFVHVLTDTAIAESLPEGHVITAVSGFKDITDEILDQMEE